MINQPPPSRIRTLNELEREIKLVKLRLKVHEADMKDRWKRLPEESIKATLGAVIPFFLRQKVASNTWSFIKVISNMFFSSSKTATVAGGGWKDILLGNAKKWGILAGVQGVLKMIKNRKKEN
ncbi:hypothetical protein [Filimonas effusa]|uniref:Uncharacterized protein n=1 Tax=Filimonas effusa TaxID=2508721 RepID=A0A4Q1D0D8_9BACT|nr:hypothetical protein [Filimonas effusa]RXK81206.1 hypothetical protein ESB13_19905 [Filimonas effusa]